MPVKDLSCSVEVEVAQPRKNIRLLQKKGKILPGDTLMSTDVDGNAAEQLASYKSELEIQKEEEDDDIRTESKRIGSYEGRTDGTISELDSGLSGLNLKSAPRTIGISDADDGNGAADTRKLAGVETVSSQQLLGDAASNVTADGSPTIVCPASVASHRSNPQGSPRIRRAFSKESENSFGNHDDNQHLNEYEVLDEIGKVSSLNVFTPWTFIRNRKVDSLRVGLLISPLRFFVHSRKTVRNEYTLGKNSQSILNPDNPDKCIRDALPRILRVFLFFFLTFTERFVGATSREREREWLPNLATGQKSRN